MQEVDHGVEKNKTDVAEVATFSLFTCLQQRSEHDLNTKVPL